MIVMIRVKFILQFFTVYTMFLYAASDKPSTIGTDDSRIGRIEDMLTNQNERIRTLENIIINQKTEILNLKSKDRVHERKLKRVSQILARSSQNMATTVVGGYANDIKMSKIQKKEEVLVKGKIVRF